MRKHGHAIKRSREYRSWESMKRRCLIANSPDYVRYGARGIKICDRWLEFVNFLEDMGNRPDGTILDRIDVNGNYEPSNCRWITYRESSGNTTKQLNKKLPVGVQLHNNKYRARIVINKKLIILGNFLTIEEAASAYQKAKYECIT